MNREAGIPNPAPYLDRNGRNGTLAFSQSDLTAANNQPPRIFIVEDDPIMKGMVVDYLEEHNMRAVSASGRQEMVRHFAASEPDLVILDLRLGQEDGFDLLREIRSRSDVPIIIITGDRRDEIDRVVGLELGADDYLTKPFSLRELLARIRARAATARDRTRCASAGSGAGPVQVRWLAARSAHPASQRPQRNRGRTDQGGICSADRLSRRAPAAAQPRAPVASNASARRCFRPQHRRPDPKIAAQTGARSERTTHHLHRARRWLRVCPSGRATLMPRISIVTFFPNTETTR
jgi:CheY-like chemotaxis protein